MNEALKLNVGKFVKTKIWDVKDVDDILNMQRFQSYHKSDDYDYERLCLLKKILQLTINVYNNYDGFKHLSVKFSPDDRSELTLFKSYYNYDPISNIWVCSGRPEEHCVIEALCNYILCYRSIQLPANPVLNDPNGKEIVLDDCSICGSSIVNKAERCEVCGETINEMKMFESANSYFNGLEIERSDKVKEATVEKEDEDSDVDNCTNDEKENSANLPKSNGDKGNSMEKRVVSTKMIPSDTIISNGPFNKDSEKNSTRLGASEMSSIANDRLDDRSKSRNSYKGDAGGEEVMKWSCGSCGLLNSHEMINCEACGTPKEGRGVVSTTMTPPQQTINQDDCRDDLVDEYDIFGVPKISQPLRGCERLDHRSNDNRLVKQDERSRNKREAGEEDVVKWRCGACRLLNVYGIIDCGACGVAMEERGLWVCKSCTFENKLVESRCYACFIVNDDMVVRFCKYCKETKVKLSVESCDACLRLANDRNESDWWQCGFLNCGVWNKDSQTFCKSCRFWKDTPFKTLLRGDPVQRFKDGGSETVWICTACCTINDDSKEVCSGWICWKFCWKSRYGRTKCQRCGDAIDGKKKVCGKCKPMIKNSNHNVSQRVSPHSSLRRN